MAAFCLPPLARHAAKRFCWTTANPTIYRAGLAFQAILPKASRFKVTLGTGEQITGYAMNDVYLERSTGQTARISLAIDGHHVVDQLSADGLILATALGSTAYSFSAGGTPCVPSLPVMCVTPICPHKPRLSPFVLPYGARAAIEVFAPERRPVRVVIDGADHEDVRSVAVGPTEHQVRMGYLSGHDFTGQMVGKLLT